MRPKKLKKRKNQEHVPGYGERFEARFDAREGRLFVADLCKSRVLVALRDLMDKREGLTGLCVVRDRRIAEEMAHLLAKEDGNGLRPRVIASEQDLLDCLAELGGGVVTAEEDTLRDMARVFAARFPRVIVCYEQDGEAVLHRSLCLNHDISGVYNSVDAAPYCMSDFFADCGYGISILDDVYAMLDFEKAENEDPNKTPFDYERLIFGGIRYYTETKHSYKRLLRLADSTPACVLLSDILLDRNLLKVYAMLNLLHPAFSFRKAREALRKHANNYTAECDEVYSTFSYCTDDENIQSICLHLLVDKKGYIPERLSDLGYYLNEGLNYLSREEVFLMALYSAYQKMGADNYYSNVDVIRRLGDDEVVASMFCAIFFSDEIKAELEVRNLFYLTDMKSEDLLTLHSMVTERGCISEPLPPASERKISYIYHDESAFEDLLRCEDPKIAKRIRCGELDHFDNHTDSYSVARRGDDTDYLCVAIKQMMEDQGLATPLLVVSDEDEASTCARFTELLPGTRCSTAPIDLFLPEEQRPSVITVDTDHLASMIPDIPVKTVIFTGGVRNPERLDRLLRKVSLLNGGTAAIRILADYRDLSGHLTDLWSNRLLGPSQDLLAVDNSDLTDSGGHKVAYSALADEVDGLYRDLRQLAEQGTEVGVEQLAERYRSLTVRFPIDDLPPLALDSVIRDLEFLGGLASAYRRIYENSVSVGSMGYASYAAKVKSDAPAGKRRAIIAGKKLGKREAELFEREEQERKIEFNVCAKQAFGRCPVTVHNCGDCEEYQELLLNRFDLFAASVEGFFGKASEVLQKTAEAEHKREVTITVNATHSRAKYFKDRYSDVTRMGENAQKQLDALKEIAEERPTLFFADYSYVDEIRKQVRNAYLVFFGEYYAVLMETLKKASEQMKTALETAGQAGASQDAKSAII